MTNLLPITKKQQSIILLISRFRFLNRIQIQHFLNHKDRKTINEWLSDLRQKGYIERIYSDTFPQKIKPAVFYIAKGGIGFLKNSGNYDQKIINLFYHDNIRSQDFIDRCLLLCDIYIDLLNPKSNKVKFEMSVANDYPNHNLKEPLGDLLPHAYLEQKRSGKPEPYFLEILGNIPITRMRQRIKKYLAFHQGSEWEAQTKEDFPSILMICPNDQIFYYIKRYLKRKPAEFDEPQMTINLTTVDKVKEFGIVGDIWTTVKAKI